MAPDVCYPSIWLLILSASMYIGAEVTKFNLSPLLYKRLHIEGSTLRSRSVEYQAKLISQ